MDWMVVSPKNSFVWILRPKVMVLGDAASGRCLGHEGIVLMNGISALARDLLELLSFFHQVMLQQKDSCLWNSKQTRGPGPEWSVTMILDFLASRTVRTIKFYCFLAIQFFILCYSSANRLRQEGLEISPAYAYRNWEKKPHFTREFMFSIALRCLMFGLLRRAECGVFSNRLCSINTLLPQQWGWFQYKKTMLPFSFVLLLTVGVKVMAVLHHFLFPLSPHWLHLNYLIQLE